jgi:mannose-P-dolichol utilization defect protein 1
MDRLKSFLIDNSVYHRLVVETGAQRALGLDSRCARVLFIRLDASDSHCLQLFVRRALGLLIVVGAAFVKLPQILKVLLAQSTEGLSLLSPFLELIAASLSFACNIHSGTSFLQHGETLMASIQNGVLIALIGLFGRQMLSTLLLSIVYAAGMSLVLSPARISPAYLRYLQAASVPLAAASRLPQLAQLLRTRRVGQLSILSVTLSALGATARLYTVRDMSNALTLTGALSSAALTWLTVILVIYYVKFPGGHRNPRKRKAA